MATSESARVPVTPAAASQVTRSAPAQRAGGASRLFVVSTHKVRERTGTPPLRWVPYGTVHAWRPGSRQTLCGEWISGWTVFWELPFSPQHAESCRACIEASLPAESRRRLAPPAQPGPERRSA